MPNDGVQSLETGEGGLEEVPVIPLDVLTAILLKILDSFNTALSSYLCWLQTNAFH